MKKFFSGFIFLILLIIFIVSGLLLFQSVEDEHQYHHMEEQIEEEKQILVEEDYEFEELVENNEINEDTIGWITIAGTSIDYPIVQASDNSYYLTHDCNCMSLSMGAFLWIVTILRTFRIIIRFYMDTIWKMDPCFMI